MAEQSVYGALSALSHSLRLQDPREVSRGLLVLRLLLAQVS